MPSQEANKLCFKLNFQLLHLFSLNRDVDYCICLDLIETKQTRSKLNYAHIHAQLNDTQEMENECVKMDFTICLRSSINVFEVLCFLDKSASSKEMHFRIFPLITEVGGVDGGWWRMSVEIVRGRWWIHFRIFPLITADPPKTKPTFPCLQIPLLTLSILKMIQNSKEKVQDINVDLKTQKQRRDLLYKR